jgi:hypothetical protein
MKVTPTEHLELWTTAFLAAVAAVEGTHKDMEPREAYRQKKADIDAILSSINCVGAYDLDGNGRPWIFSAKIPDPMTAPVIQTDVTKKVKRDINGFKHRNNGAGEHVIEKSEDQKYWENPPAEVPVATDEVPAFKRPRDYTFGSPEQLRKASARGQKLAVMAASMGKNPELAGQMGWCVSLREQGLPPHERMEAHLARKGVYVSTAVKAA